MARKRRALQLNYKTPIRLRAGTALEFPSMIGIYKRPMDIVAADLLPFSINT